jgi:hypothetical protein
VNYEKDELKTTRMERPTMTATNKPSAISGITLKRPWTWAVSHLDKRIENRTWVPHIKKGHFLAIHAGKGWDELGHAIIDRACRDGLFDGLPPEKADCPQGIVAVARYGGLYDPLIHGDDEWFIGPHGWILEDVVTLVEPIPCSGKQGLWAIDPELLQAIRTEWRRSVPLKPTH